MMPLLLHGLLPAEYDEGNKYLLRIEEAHRAASSAAMALLRGDLGLANGLSVLKRYFLTAQVGGGGGVMLVAL